LRIVAYYIIGAVFGVALILGVWWIDPGLLQRDRDKGPAIEALPAAEVHLLNAGIYESRQNAITNAVAMVSPAVVGINVTSIREYRSRSFYNPFFDDPVFRGMFPERVWQQKVENLGSGFIISPEGYVLTNEHVVNMASEIIVTMTDDKKYNAQVVGYDYDSDIALLKVDAADLPYIKFGNSDDVLIGEWAIALGNPFGLFAIHSQPSVTVGVVSAVDRDFDRNQDGRLYQDMVQTDASINRGNSGGPLVNSAGELIGMNTMIFTESGGSIGLGFAIPSNKLVELYEILRDRGGIDRDFSVGLSLETVDRVAAVSLKLPEVSGAVITDIDPGSSADKSGLAVADVIVRMCDRDIKSTIDIRNIMKSCDLRVGDAIDIDIFRGGERRTIKMKLEKRKG
jgi:serine protease Do